VIHHLNGLLARLDESFARERSFSANLAHELRTPLSELRAVTDVALKWPEDTASHLEAIAEVRGIGLQMERVVVNLLALARFDGRQHTVWPSEVSLGALAASCWNAVASEAGDKGIGLQLDIPEGLAVVTDREKLALILSNLFSNAVAHGSPGGVVTCSGSMDGESFVLRVGNPAGSLTPEDLPRIFDRFWRKDPARSGGRHAGLGLALVSALCGLLGFEKEARLAGGWLEITLRGRAAAASSEFPGVADPQQRGALVVVADRAE
jgi:two-component system sensor histidine kinase QseC